jgi:hypothetical protein
MPARCPGPKIAHYPIALLPPERRTMPARREFVERSLPKGLSKELFRA